MLQLVSQMIWPVTRPVAQWAEHSQQQACRNAMVASTAIAALRRERDDVQEFVDTLIARRAGQAVSHLPAARLG